MVPVATVDELMEMGHGYQRSMTLFAALDLGVFSALSAGPSDAGRLARRLVADPRRLAILLNALVAAGLLEKKGKTYRNGKIAARFLAEGPSSKASILLHHLDCWPEWTKLPDTIRSRRRRPGEKQGYQENFIRGMEDNARERAVFMAGQYPLRKGERVLDLGGGPGTYAVEWAKRYPGVRVTVFDTSETLAVTRKILEEKGASGLIALREGDFLRDRLGGPYDFVWISQILHAYAEKECVFLLRKVRKAVAAGGRVAVQEFLLEKGGTSPPGPAFFSVHMVAVTEGGKAYTAREIASFFRAAGYRRVSEGRPDVRGVGVVSAFVGT
ncbi:MAG TPA: methyltransferase [Candidatus Deferrimicrobiaceae bacterium]|nr:methyltransferase [Candidatus Deferrimicrobiaceae bacterium]